MLIACKYEEMYIPQVEDFVYITDEAYKSKEILSMVFLNLINNDRCFSYFIFEYLNGKPFKQK